MLAVRNRNMPELSPFHVLGNPPAKSACRLAEVFAPAHVGPKTSRPISDCRMVAPKLPVPLLGPVTKLGKSWLSVAPWLLKRFKRTMPESRTRYLDAPSTLV